MNRKYEIGDYQNIIDEMKFFMDIMSHQLVNIWQRLEGTYYFHLNNQAVLEEKLNSWII